MYAVYTIVEREKRNGDVWIRIGSAFPNSDGSINVLLLALPLNGKLQLRKKNKEAKKD